MDKYAVTMSNRSNPARRLAAGFTLLEVLVALVVLSVALAAAIEAASTYNGHASHLRDKTWAHWVAMNQLTELQVQRSFPDLGTSNGKAQMANAEWQWQTTVSETPNPAMRQVRVEVKHANDKRDGNLASLNGYIADPAYGIQSTNQANNTGSNNNASSGNSVNGINEGFP